MMQSPDNRGFVSYSRNWHMKKSIIKFLLILAIATPLCAKQDSIMAARMDSLECASKNTWDIFSSRLESLKTIIQNLSPDDSARFVNIRMQDDIEKLHHAIDSINIVLANKIDPICEGNTRTQNIIGMFGILITAVVIIFTFIGVIFSYRHAQQDAREQAREEINKLTKEIDQSISDANDSLARLFRQFEAADSSIAQAIRKVWDKADAAIVQMQNISNKIQSNPEDASLYNDLAITFDKAGRYKEALGAFTKAIELSKGNAADMMMYLINRSATKLKMGDLAGASADQEQAARITMKSLTEAPNIPGKSE